VSDHPTTDRKGIKLMTAQDFDDLDMACRREDINGMQAIAAIRRRYEALAASLAPEPRGEQLLISQAARLIREHVGDAHDEDVQEMLRWLAVYDSRFPETKRDGA
jgi:hypothetical protein